MGTVISFDIDGTLEVGDPPGPISMEMVRRAREHGCIVGSSSDRHIPAQKEIWAKIGIQADFMSLKHMLSGVKAQFAAERYIHTGDTNMDRQAARESGFEFMELDVAAGEPWLAWTNGHNPVGQ